MNYKIYTYKFSNPGNFLLKPKTIRKHISHHWIIEKSLFKSIIRIINLIYIIENSIESKIIIILEMAFIELPSLFVFIKKF